MSIFFDSPIEYCPVANRYVLLDQTQKSCARDMDCHALNCPLARFFARPVTPGAEDKNSRKQVEQPTSKR